MKYCSFLLIIFMAIFCSCNPEPSSRETFVHTYLERYPKATLQDIYKGSFQDVFGPAHLLRNREAVINYIQHEIESNSPLAGEDYVPCGWQGNFFQVNLKIIADGRISINDFADAFIASANGIDTTLTKKWLEEWQLLQQTVRKVSPTLEGFTEDSIIIANLLREGKYVVHHSRKFNQHYQPHYRIIRKDIFQKNILPYLK